MPLLWRSRPRHSINTNANICYNSVMNWPHRQLMQHFLAAMLFAVATPHDCLASCLVHGQLTNEVQNGVSIARTYDSLNRPTGYTIMQNAECRMQNDGGATPSTLQPFNRHLLLRLPRPLRLRFRTGRDALRRVRQPFNHLHLRLRSSWADGN